MAVYDDEKTKETSPGSHDDLGVHPERREAVNEDLEKKLNAPDIDADDAETKSLQSYMDKARGLDKARNEAKDEDPDQTGFYRSSKKGFTGKSGSRIRAAGGVFSNRKLMAGVGGAGAVGLIITSLTLFNFLHTFQLDHFFKNTDAKASQRLYASLDTRNKKLVQSYIKARVTEIEGGAPGDNLYFRANKVSGTNSFFKFYDTMRTSNFESKLLTDNGIQFVSMVDKNGQIKIAQITRLKDPGAIDPVLAAKVEGINNKNMTTVLNSMSQSDLEQVFTVDKFDNHKAARKSVQEVVNSQIPWKPNFKRRHIRQDIANMTGIKSWRLFEKTRDKIAKKKEDIKNQLIAKIVDRYYGNNPSSAAFIKCLFADGRCNTNTDPQSPDNKTSTPTEGAKSEADNALGQSDSQGENTDKAGETKSNELKTGEAGDALDNAIKDTIKKDATEDVTQAATGAAENQALNLTLGQKVTVAITKAAAGDSVSEAIPFNPTLVWTWLKRIAKLDGMLYSAKEASKLSKMITGSKRAQTEGLYATYAMGNDQIKSGDLVGDQLNSFFATTANLGNTEGWAVLSGQIGNNAGSVSTDQNQNPDKEKYCNTPPEQRDPKAFAWACDDQKVSSGGNADVISKGYQTAFGTLIHPVATVVDAAGNSPPAKFLDFITNQIGKVTNVVLGPAIQAALSNIKFSGKSITDWIGIAVNKLMAFLGAGPMFDGSQPGLGNLLVQGAAATAEDSTRTSGGIKQTAITKAYTSQLAAGYASTQKKHESLYDRYASLTNQDSLASNAMFAVASNSDTSTLFSKLSAAVTSLPRTLASVFGGWAYAAQPVSATGIADWSGLEKYDIPQQCQDLDFTDPDYLTKATNAQPILASYGIANFTLDLPTMRDTNKWSTALYTAIGDREDAQTIAEKVYDCALWDARVEGSVGANYGYKDDNPYNPGGQSSSSGPSSSSASNANLYMVGDSYTVGLSSAGLGQKLHDNGWNASINGLVSRHIQGVPPSPDGIGQITADQAVASQAGTIIIALGTNDLGTPVDQFNAELGAIYDKAKSVSPNAQFFFINYYVNDPSRFPDHGKAKVDALAAFAASKNAKVIDWASIAPPDYTKDPIHPDSYEPLVNLITQQVGKAPVAGAAP